MQGQVRCVSLTFLNICRLCLAVDFETDHQRLPICRRLGLNAYALPLSRNVNKLARLEVDVVSHAGTGRK